jgi:SAM-dependent methyltransferase
MTQDNATAAWLRENRDHRMDALNRGDIFSSDRQAFHSARYRFASTYVRDLLVADIACGLGYGCRILKEGGAKRAIGIDASYDAIAYARSKHSVEGTMFEVADATLVPLATGSVDTIASFETIEHISNTTGLLSEFRRVLKTHGKLIVSSPNDWGLTTHHCHTWTPFEFMAEVAAFFTIESVWEQNSNTNSKSVVRSFGIYPWSPQTAHLAECLIVVAQKPAMDSADLEPT